MPEERIRARVQQYPEGQLVLERSGRVLGVIYSQRIATVETLESANASNVHELHDPSGPIVQLLAVNVDPEVQNLGYGDQLLELMLQRCSLAAGVRRVVGVTLCKRYAAQSGQPFERYIEQRVPVRDPVLAFHEAHGARIVKAIAHYRPEDQVNLENGVLVSYDIHHRVSHRRQIEPEEVSPEVSVPEPTGAKHGNITRVVQEGLIRLLGTKADGFDLDRPVMEMGLDSADLLQLQQELEQAFQQKFRAGFFFEYNTAAKIIDYLVGCCVSCVTSPKPPAVPPAAMTNDRIESLGFSGGGDSARDIAVVGMSCKLPGGIETPQQLWEVLVAEKCVIGTFPTSRGSWPSPAERAGIDRGGFVQDADAFDAAFFRISPAEAKVTDPQQRMLLELAWACLEDAGITPASIRGTDTGVFVGASNCDYGRLLHETGVEVGAHHGLGSSLAILANRLSYFFDLSGPSLLIDTACSSSLVALHTALQSLRNGECTAALVGGVNLLCQPDLSIAYHKAGMLSADGRCKVFDASANGYVRSEGAVVLLLKPLSVAIADHDPIHAVIKGSAINHGGLAGGLTVPNPRKQSELLQAAWRNAGVAAGSSSSPPTDRLAVRNIMLGELANFRSSIVAPWGGVG